MKNSVRPLAAALTALLLTTTISALGGKTNVRSIVKIDNVNIDVMVGNVPLLPWQVWVTYNDGTHEWRQVRWSNSDLAEEKRLADSQQTPVGSKYTIRGFILGDNSTQQGYPIDANVNVVELAKQPHELIAEPLPLYNVRLTGNNRLTSNRDLDVRMLIELDITQQLYNYRDTYGLPTEAQWGDVTVRQDCEWPAEQSRLTFSGGKFALKLRVPYWATSGFQVKLNGKSVAKNYQPCSYVEIPERQWTASDVVEVVMPFTKHVFYGPDKMDQAFVDGQTTPFAAQWTGVLMYGPLVMTSPDIHTWQDASLKLSPTLSDVQLTNTAPYTLTACGKTFLPDYYVTTEHTTHYLRLDIPSGYVTKSSTGKLNIDELKQKLQMARERKAADWAPHGYQRLQDKIAETESIIASTSSGNHATQTQSDIDYATSALNVAIISMRPSNLAEPEDLTELTAMLEKARQVEVSTPELREAINYARMVIRYVNDGSGTHDMITKAIDKLNQKIVKTYDTEN